MYHAIGKEAWDELPSMFSNAELADKLTEDCAWWTYTYMFPHDYRVDKNGEPLMCEMEAWIRFTKSDGVFKKVLRPV